MTVIKELKRFYKKFKGEKGVIGRTQNNAKIYYFALKKTEYPKIIITYSIHAREYITTYLALNQIKDFARFGKRGCVYFVPMINIDGVKKALSKNPLYKANARGVDLNVNFDARWGKGEKNVRVKGAQNYIGTHPFSERWRSRSPRPHSRCRTAAAGRSRSCRPRCRSCRGSQSRRTCCIAGRFFIGSFN